MSTSAEAAIKSAAIQKQYQNVLFLVEGEDLKAKEAQYHHSCFRTYTYMPKERLKPNEDNYFTFCKKLLRNVSLKLVKY
jgi:hypothetical protein